MAGGGIAQRRARRDENEIRRIEDAIVAATLRTAREHAKFGPAVEAALRRVRFAYRPCWHVGSRSLAIFRCTPVMEQEFGLVEGDDVLPNPGARDLHIMLDHLTLANVLLDIETLLRDKRDGMVVVPLHYASFLEDWAGNPLAQMLHHIPKSGRPRVVFEIIDAFAGRTDSRIRGVVQLLRPYCGRLGANLPLRINEHRFWRELGFSVVSTDLTGYDGSESDLIAGLDRFVLGARPLGLRTAAIGLGSRSLVLAAATMGFDIVHGANVAHFADRDVFGRVPFDFSDLYADQLLMGEV